MTGTGRRRGEPAAKESYGTEQFSFVDDTNTEDVIDWLAFAETRTERRDERRRRFRNRTVALLVALVLVIVAAGGYLLFQLVAGGEEEGGPRTAVLFQMRGAKGEAVVSAVLLQDSSTGRGAVLAVPASLSLQSQGGEPISFRNALAEDGPSYSRDTLSDLLGVQLDGSWILEEVAFSSLVDRLGGLAATAEVDTAAPVVAGDRRLGGVAALRYATVRTANEPEKQQLQRLQDVLQTLLQIMPTNAQEATQLLDNLGVIPDPALSNERLGAALAGMAAAADTKRVVADTLPVRVDGLIDPGGAGPVVKQMLGGSVRRSKASGPPRILVQDGIRKRVDRQSGQQAAAVRLLGAGYRYINGGKADRRFRTTVIHVADSTPNGKGIGEQVALTLGVPTSAVSVVEGDEIAADVVVFVGEDFRP